MVTLLNWEKVLLMSENISLKYLFDQQNLNARQARWLSFLSEYGFEKKHIKGKQNKVADALSRYANLLCASSCYESYLGGHILSTWNSDRKYQSLKEKTAKNEQEQVKIDFILNQQGLLLYKDMLYILHIREIKLTVMDELHKIPYSGHLGYQKMITMIRKDFFWKNMKKEVSKYLARFLECQ